MPIYHYFKSSSGYIQGKFPENDPLFCDAFLGECVRMSPCWVGKCSIFLWLVPSSNEWNINWWSLWRVHWLSNIAWQCLITDEAWREVKVFDGLKKKMLKMKIIQIIIELIFYGGIFQNLQPQWHLWSISNCYQNLLI